MQQNLLDNNIDITVEQWRLLFYLWKEDGINQQELANASNKEKSTMTRQIDVLEKKGLISRRPSETDKRNKLIYLTNKGKKMEKSALFCAQSVTLKSLENIDEESISVFKNVMYKIIENLN